jgi:repressor LexA
MVRRLTGRQEAVLEFVKEYQAERGYSPTLREIADHFGIASQTAVRDHLRALEEKGMLRRSAGSPRALAVVGAPSAGLPLIGEVPAGKPVMSDENRQGTVDLGNWFGDGRETFVLRVKGESMIDDGIRDGDMVVVRHQETIESGQVGVVFVAGEATVKRVFLEGDRVRLQPANQGMLPMVFHRDDVDLRIAGRVIGVVRKL